MSRTFPPEWLAAARPTAATVLWSASGWQVTAGGLSEDEGLNAIAAESLADVREDGLLVWPISTAAGGPRIDFEAFLRAFRMALKLHQCAVDPDVLKRTEKLALKVRSHSDREWKAKASAWRTSRY